MYPKQDISNLMLTINSVATNSNPVTSGTGRLMAALVPHAVAFLEDEQKRKTPLVNVIHALIVAPLNVSVGMIMSLLSTNDAEDLNTLAALLHREVDRNIAQVKEMMEPGNDF